MVTNREIDAARTPNGGYTREQLSAWGVPWPPPKGWKDILMAGGYRPAGGQDQPPWALDRLT